LYIDEETSEKTRSLVAKGYNAFKFGWARVNFNYFISPEEVEFICDSIAQIAEHGWKLLPLYEVDLKSALFVHRRKLTNLNRPSLSNLDLFSSDGAMDAGAKKNSSFSFKKVLADADNMYVKAEKFLRLYGQYEKSALQVESAHFDSISADDIWWVTTKNVVEAIKGEVAASRVKNPKLWQDAWSVALEC